MAFGLIPIGKGKERIMVNIIFSFEVAKENQEEFLSFVKSGTKPWWEAHGCLGYNVWQAAGENAFVKIMEFPDMATMEKVVPANEKDPECKALIEKFESYTINISRKPFVKMT
jgi:quinol monooxygenase YgiN